MKAFLYSFLLLVTTSTLGFGQGRFSISATLSPTQRKLDYRTGIQDSSPNSYGTTIIAKDQGGTLGLTATYQFHPNWSVSSGLWYNRSTGYQDFQAFRNNEAVGAEPTRRTTLNTVQLPVLINFSPSKHRFSPYLSTGLVFNMNYRSKIGNYFNSTVEPAITHSSQINTHILLGLGAQYRINPRVSLIVQPTALYKLDYLGQGSAPAYASHYSRRVRDWQLGVQAQLKYTF